METSTQTPAKKKLRIALVLDKFLPSRGGESYFVFLIDSLLKEGHEVHVCAAKTEGKDERVIYHRVRVWKWPRSLRMVTFMRNADALVKREEFDVVHGLGQNLALTVLNPHGGVEKAYLKCEFASLGGGPYYVYRLLRRYLSVRHYLELWMQKKLYGRNTAVRKVIAIAPMIKNDIMNYYGFPEKKIDIVFNSVNLEKFVPANRERFRRTKRSELGIDEEEIVLLFVGNNYRLKGVKYLIRALARVKERVPDRKIRLLIAGRGHAREYRALASRLGLSGDVLFLGPIGGVEKYYGASDIYVHPTFYDSCSLTVLEALASGLPVITTRTNGANAAISTREAGIVLEDTRDIDSLAEAINYYLDPDRRHRAVAAARTCAEQFPPEKNIAQTLEVYRQATSAEMESGLCTP